MVSSNSANFGTWAKSVLLFGYTSTSTNYLTYMCISYKIVPYTAPDRFGKLAGNSNADCYWPAPIHTYVSGSFEGNSNNLF
jgi:hypothetical protein